MRWGEAIGLEREYLKRSHVNVEWQLREVNGTFYRLPPKDDSYRSTNWEPRLPVDLPPFLTTLLDGQAAKHAQHRCACTSQHGGSGQYIFTGPDGGHYRRSNHARRIFRPACDGRYEPVRARPGKLVIADATTWPGRPVASWPPAQPNQPFAAPTGAGVPVLISTEGKGRCPNCGHALVLRRDGRLISHVAADARCPGSGQQPAEDAPLVCWLPVKTGLTRHGLRHSQKTWMAEDGIPEILAEQRLGHEVPGMRGLYTHASDRMRNELVAALQQRWEDSLRARAAIDPHSPVPLLDALLAPYGGETTQPAAPRLTLAPAPPPKRGRDGRARAGTGRARTGSGRKDDLPNSSQNDESSPSASRVTIVR